MYITHIMCSSKADFLTHTHMHAHAPTKSCSHALPCSDMLDFCCHRLARQGQCSSSLVSSPGQVSQPRFCLSIPIFSTFHDTSTKPAACRDTHKLTVCTHTHMQAPINPADTTVGLVVCRDTCYSCSLPSFLPPCVRLPALLLPDPVGRLFQLFAEDEQVLEAAASIISACSGAQASGGKVRAGILAPLT